MAEIQMIHGYADATDDNDLTSNQVFLDSDVGVGKDPTTWTSKKLDTDIFRAWLSKNLSFVHGYFLHAFSQYCATINTAKSVEFGIGTNSYGVNCVGNTDFSVSEDGDYRIDIQLQAVRSSGGSNQHIDLWLNLNGSNLEYSNKHLTLVSNSGHVLLSLTYIQRLSSTDVIKVMWAVSSTDIFLQADAATSLHPINPSSSISITKL
jgi:hypothetical protein